MSSVSSHGARYNPKHNEICIGNIGNKTEPSTVLTYFEKFGKIIRYNFTSSTGGYVFITYADPSIIDDCMNSRPHYLDNRHLYVKRSLPVDDEHPRERFEPTRDLMIVMDSEHQNYYTQHFLSHLRDYFSSYGRIFACTYSHETNFDYILVQFGDTDNVDRIILDKPHYCNDYQLDVMKRLASNIEITNKKYSSKKLQPTVIRDAIDDDNYDFSRSRNNGDKHNSTMKEPISETDLQNEVYRLQNVLRKMAEEFAMKRKQAEDDCTEQLKKLSEDTRRTQSLQQDLEQEHAKLLAEYESTKQENEILNEQYLAAELENFEITSYYEQILAEEKAKTVQLQAEYTQELTALNKSDPSSFSSSSSQLTMTSPATSKSPSHSNVSDNK